MARKKKALSNVTRNFDARPDRADFRDRLYEPGLHEVPREMPLSRWQKHKVPVLNQGEDGACVGFSLATVANFLLRNRSARTSVSPRMMYEMAKDYDEWPGDDYSGSSCKGGVKGWQRHGVCVFGLWPHDPKVKGGELTEERAADAAMRPLGSYYRVNPHDLRHVHAALAEVGVLYASGDVHEGWWEPDEKGVIAHSDVKAGGHAFAIVGYDAYGFWIQNSWGPEWGINGCARLPYASWIRDGYDVWVCRTGVPVIL